MGADCWTDVVSCCTIKQEFSMPSCLSADGCWASSWSWPEPWWATKLLLKNEVHTSYTAW